MFFYPQKQLVRTPQDIGLAYEDVTFSSLDGTRLHGWFLPAQGPAKATVVFVHGNAENISTHVAAVYWLPAAGYNVFAFDYRGYGRSEGKESLDGVHLDARAALDYVRGRADVDPARLVLFGQSLGGAVALYTAATSQVPLRAVVVESSFSDYRKIFREKLSDLIITWPLQWPLSFTVSDQYSPLAVIADLKAPLLVIHGDADPIVPVSHAHALYSAAKGDKTLWIIEQGGHTAAFGPMREVYRPKLVEYLESRLAGGGNPH
ncbi:MAG: alpha/beta fold hydrolase [Pseudomonadota bacterium]